MLDRILRELHWNYTGAFFEAAESPQMGTISAFLTHVAVSSVG